MVDDVVNEIVGDNRSWSSGSEDGETDDGSAGDVSTNKEHAGPETLTVDELRFREIKQAHSKTSIWKQMESMSMGENESNGTIPERKRKRGADDVEAEESVNKKIRSVEELVTDMLAELPDSVDIEWETYCRGWKLKDVGKKEEGENSLFLRMLLD